MSLSTILKLRRPLVLFDLETTGLDPASARICQISMRVHSPEGEVKAYTSLVNPGVPINNSEIHKVTDEMIAHGCAKCGAPKDLHPLTDCAEPKPVPTFQEIGGTLYRGFVNADFGGKNIRYDLEVIKAEFSRLNLQFDYTQAYRVDVERLWQILEPRSLSDAVERFLGRKHKNPHNAQADIEETEDVIIAQLTAHTRSADLKRDIADLHEQCYPRDKDAIDTEGKFKFVKGVAVLNFGKKTKKDGTPLKGLPLSDPDVQSYLKWMVQAEFSGEVKKIASDALQGKYPTRA